MALSQMEVFNKYVMPSTIETLGQMIDKFNAASVGTIILSTEGFAGDFLQESFFASLHAAQRRVDRYAANGAQAATDLTQLKHSSVKVGGGFGPILFEPAQLTWLSKPTAEGIEVISRNLAEAILQDQLNTAIAALVAAIENQPTATADLSATTALTYAAINTSHGKFGDASSNILATVMRGTANHNLIGQNITNATRLFESRNVNVVDILGKVTIITDAPALYEAGVPNKMKALGLTANAAIVHDGADMISNIATTNGKERIETTMQVDYSFGLGLKGYTWDETNGGKSPTDAELATGTNWDKVATDIKHTAGVIAIGDADL